MRHVMHPNDPQQKDIRLLPEAPVMSIFLSLLHSRMPTVSLPDVGTYRREKQMSPKYYNEMT